MEPGVVTWPGAFLGITAVGVVGVHGGEHLFVLGVLPAGWPSLLGIGPVLCLHQIAQGEGVGRKDEASRCRLMLPGETNT